MAGILLVGEGHAAVRGGVDADASVYASGVGALTFQGAVDLKANAGGTDVGVVTAYGNNDIVGEAHSYDGYVYASVDGGVGAHAEIYADHLHSLTFSGDVTVTAGAHGTDVGTVTATGSNAHVAVDPSYGGHVDIRGGVSADGVVEAEYVDTVAFNGDVTITGNANGYDIGIVTANGHDARVDTGDGYLDRYTSVDGHVGADAELYVEYVGTLTARGRNVTAMANASGSHVGAIEANGNSAHIGSGRIYGAVGGEAYVEVEYASTASFQGRVTVTANANGSHVGTAEANGNDVYVDPYIEAYVDPEAYVEASDIGNVNFAGKVSVAANAQGKYVGAVTATGDGYVDPYIEAYVEPEAYVETRDDGIVTFGQVGVNANANGSNVAEVTYSSNDHYIGYGDGYVEAQAYLEASSVGFAGFGPVAVNAKSVGHTIGGSVDGDAYVYVAGRRQCGLRRRGCRGRGQRQLRARRCQSICRFLCRSHHRCRQRRAHGGGPCRGQFGGQRRDRQRLWHDRGCPAHHDPWRDEDHRHRVGGQRRRRGSEGHAECQ